MRMGRGVYMMAGLARHGRGHFLSSGRMSRHSNCDIQPTSNGVKAHLPAYVHWHALERALLPACPIPLPYKLKLNLALGDPSMKPLNLQFALQTLLIDILIPTLSTECSQPYPLFCLSACTARHITISSDRLSSSVRPSDGQHVPATRCIRPEFSTFHV